ncbi:hypothetical protein HPB47_007384 [Ixodes persulcatus]|uniref:Uncharacterized protein n=1 Tax=Ixodes persulcatus TaxID=34615 RepID=A0AC60P823_IXOPE|nr:hypothetical protein HPB47_007384 [Ixodes persulcatus]
MKSAVGLSLLGVDVNQESWGNTWKAECDSLFCKITASSKWPMEGLLKRSVAGTLSNKAKAAGQEKAFAPLTPLMVQAFSDPELKRRLVDQSRQLGLCPYEDTPRRPANPPAESSEASDTLLVRFASTHDSGFSSPVSSLDKSFRFVQ